MRTASDRGLRRVSALAGIACWAGCPAALPGSGQIATACQESADCPSGQSCVQGYCHAGVAIDAGTVPEAATGVDARGDGGAVTDAGPDALAADRTARDVSSERLANDVTPPDRATESGAADRTAGDGAGLDSAAGADVATPDAGTPVIERLYHATAALTGSNSSLEVPLPATVDASNSVLIFSATSGSNVPSDGHAAGQLVNGGSAVRFTRTAGNNVTVEIDYTVLSIAGARVLRGSAALASGVGQVTPALSPPVDRGRSFALYSLYVVGSNYNSNDWVRLALDSDSALAVTRGDTGDPVYVEWQVVELPAGQGVSVSSGDLELPVGTTSADAVVNPALDPRHAVLLFSQQVNTWTSNEVRSHGVRGRIVDGDTLRFSRGEAVVEVRLTWFAVRWPALTVQHGETVFGAGVAEQIAALPVAVDLGRAVALSPASQRQGETALDENDDHIGAIWWTCGLRSGNELLLRRGHSVGSSTLSWSVVEFR